MTEAAVIRVPDGFEEEWPGSQVSATEVVLNVLRAGEVMHARVDACVRQCGLPSITALIVLEVLRGERGPLTPSEVAARCVLSRPALTGVMTTLEGRGYLRRYPHPRDRRRQQVEITPQGTVVTERLLPVLHRAEVAWAAGLPKADREVLLDHLGRLLSHLPAVSDPLS